MIALPREHPGGLLTRHFFHALFDLGVLSTEGADAFVRVIIGVLSLLISLGLLLARVYLQKYGALAAAHSGEPYAQAVLADTTLALALPMWIVAFVTVFVSHSLFPDETDFRVLTPLPIGRPMVFVTKLVALALFAGLFTLTSHVAVTPLVLLISVGRWGTEAAALTMAAFWIAGAAASTFALLTVVAINGLIVTCTRTDHVRVMSAAMRSAMLGALMLALPFVLSLPTQSLRLAQHSSLLLFAPPAWFLGVDRVLLGHRDAYFLRLAQTGAVAFVTAAIIASWSYVILYRRFDRVMRRSSGVSSRGTRRWFASGNPARAAVRDFTTATLRRSALHQSVLAGLSACGLALAVNILFRNGVVRWLGELPVPRRGLLDAMTELPFPLIVVLGIAASASLALPIEPKANWVFRMTERDEIRADLLSAADRVMTRLAAVLPVALTLPIQWMVVGPRAFLIAAMTGVFGLLWVEVLLRDWRRIPFTCSYIPGRHSVPQSFLAGIGVLVMAAVASAVEAASLRSPTLIPGLVMVAVLSVLVAGLRRRRRVRWRETPLAFDDELPSDVHLLRLSDH